MHLVGVGGRQWVMVVVNVDGGWWLVASGFGALAACMVWYAVPATHAQHGWTNMTHNVHIFSSCLVAPRLKS